MFRSKRLPPEIVYLFLLFLFLLLVGSVGIFRPLRGVLEKSLVIPVKEKVYSVKRIFKKDLGTCGKTNEGELSALKVKVAALTEENTAQRKLLSVPLPRDWRFLTVQVINLEGETLVINAGSKDGVTKGMTALSETNYLGKVETFGENMAWIRPPSFYGERTVVRFVENEQTAGKGLLIGQGEGRMRAEQIFSSEAVREGNLVAVDVLGGSLLVGKVSSVTVKKGEAFKTAQVERLFNPEDLRTVFLVTGKI